MNKTPIIIGIVVFLLLALLVYGLITRWSAPLFRALVGTRPTPTPAPVPTAIIPSPTVILTPTVSATLSPLPTSKVPQPTTPSSTTAPVTSIYGVPIRQFFIGSELNVPMTNQKVTLVEGNNQVTTGQGQATITLGDRYAARQTANGFDVIGFINFSTSGTQNQQQYLVLYQATPQTKNHSSSILVDDNIRITEIRTGDTPNPGRYGVIVSYLDRREGESLSAPPTISKESIFEVENHLFVQELSNVK